MIKISIDMTKKSRIIIGSLLMQTTLSFAEYTPQKNRSFADDKYVLVFSDEFNLPNGSQPDSTKWSRCKRYDSEWNRWVSSSRNVVFIKNGTLICRAIPNTKEKSDTATMLTGAIWTRNKYAFQYGRLLVRMKTNVIMGN